MLPLPQTAVRLAKLHIHLSDRGPRVLELLQSVPFTAAAQRPNSDLELLLSPHCLPEMNIPLSQAFEILIEAYHPLYQGKQACCGNVEYLDW